jgi:transitional endoplasmic reticulum ATPase
MVNEMLTQLETFGGTLFVTSNWAERLDPASLRRFDLKVEFDAMRPQQALQMLGHLCERIGLAFDPAAVRPGDLVSMTPGLFSLVLRQARFRPVTDLNDLIGRLRAEAARVAGDSRRPMGFLVPVAA